MNQRLHGLLLFPSSLGSLLRILSPNVCWAGCERDQGQGTHWSLSPGGPPRLWEKPSYAWINHQAETGITTPRVQARRQGHCRGRGRTGETRSPTPASTGGFCEKKTLQVTKLALTSHKMLLCAPRQPAGRCELWVHLEMPLDVHGRKGGTGRVMGELQCSEPPGDAKSCAPSYTHQDEDTALIWQVRKRG